DAMAAREIYSSYGYESPSAQKADLQDDLPAIANALYERMSHARASIPQTAKTDWVREFSDAITRRKQEMVPVWESKWPELCDGKALVSELHKKSDMRMSEASFKSRIAQQMRLSSSDNWRIVKGILEEFIR